MEIKHAFNFKWIIAIFTIIIVMLSTNLLVDFQQNAFFKGETYLKIQAPAHAAIKDSPQHPKQNHTLFITWLNVGRLGNNIFQLVATYMTALHTGHRAIMQDNNYMLSYFPNISIEKVHNKEFMKSIKFHSINNVELAAKFDRNLTLKARMFGNIRLTGQYQSWMYFTGYEDDIRRQLKVNKKYIEKAQTKIHHLTGEYKKDKKKETQWNITYVGVHVRRGDFTLSSSNTKGFSVAPVSYIHKAMTYYTNLFPQVIFIVSSDDINWCKTKINKVNQTVFFTHESMIDDFSMLISCNHSVITSGTYGWWSGWLTGGLVVYYRLYPRPGSNLDKRLNRTEYYPESWIPMA